MSEPTFAVLTAEIWAVREALSHIPDFEVREPNLHLTTRTCRAILRDAASVVQALGDHDSTKPPQS